MKTIIKTAIVALTLVAGASAGQAQPGTPWLHFPYKGAPYATQSEPGSAKPALVQKARQGTPVQVKPASKLRIIR